MHLDTLDIVHEKVKTEIASVFVKNENIILIEFIEYYTVEPKHLRSIQDAVLSLTNGRTVCILVKAGKYGSISEEAKKLDIFNSEKVSAVAVLTTELHQKLLGTLYFKMNRKPYPYRLFRKEENAVNWLMEFA